MSAPQAYLRSQTIISAIKSIKKPAVKYINYSYCEVSFIYTFTSIILKYPGSIYTFIFRENRQTIPTNQTYNLPRMHYTITI